MARNGLFDDLPPVQTTSTTTAAPCPVAPLKLEVQSVPPKSAIKRHSEEDEHGEGAKRVRFKTAVDATSLQIADAMQKIASHIGNAAKFSKASKLALQLLQSGGVSNDTSDLFFEILRSSMRSPMSVTDQSRRVGYQDLFSAVSEHIECFNPLQQAQIKVWILWAQVANDFFTDDTFVFSRAANKVKQEISSLPEATPDEDALDVATNSETNAISELVVKKAESGSAEASDCQEVDNDPFGLNQLLSRPSKKEERNNRKKEEEAAIKEVLKHEERLLRERREALMACLEIAAGRYRLKWAQTIIDILVKHAFDNMSKFTTNQRHAVENLWNSVREQQVRRRQGKSATGKLDVTGFERFQNQYSHAKISIRRSVGADGDRSAEQWLG